MAIALNLKIWWKGAGLYAPRNHGSVIPGEGNVEIWYSVEDEDDARYSNLGTPQYFEEPNEDMEVLIPA